MNEPGSTEHESEGRLKELVEGGSEIAGAAVGGALGFIAGPPGVVAGAVGGVVVTRSLKRVGREISERFFSSRQQVRIGAAFAFAADSIRSRLDSGEKPRDDEFFETKPDGRAEAEELLEGVLHQAADAYEERKVQHFGLFFASLAFDDSVSSDYANFLLRSAERLTYRQLALLTMVGSGEYHDDFLRLQVAKNDRAFNLSPEVSAELTDLSQSTVIGIAQRNGGVAPAYSTWNGGSLGTGDLQKLRPTSVGHDLIRLMRLDLIPIEYLKSVLSTLGC